MNYYNEFEPRTAHWLREIIQGGEIPNGVVDERCISQVCSDDLLSFTQCHFFAGIGGWPLALEMAGWDKNDPVWTGSCPCQPFSSAGKQLKYNDHRHLWPTWFHLIKKCLPSVVFGEQVASKSSLSWLDGVFSDLENEGYTCIAADLCAASVGAPHVRQRLFWAAIANTNRHGLQTVSNEKALRLQTRDRGSTGRLGKMGSTPFWSEPCPPGARPLEMGNGVSGEVDTLRGFGNAIIPELAARFVLSVQQALGDYERPRRVAERSHASLNEWQNDPMLQ